MMACTTDKRPISYGKDGCAFCKMTIMDNRFGAEMVNPKGKIFTFDSGECLVRYIHLHKADLKPKDRYFVTDFRRPGVLIEAQKATFVHGPGIESPMGGNLAAASTSSEAKEIASHSQAELLSWQEVLALK